ncbi:hypothetical protein GCM10010168_17750 [Actinoplanes ianthinogenes]|uniref:Ricin B lectin domain-containing protein n=1 Tax=Actinoplanes ianthinogenes TaxID=122358 RepID=A0ABN6CT49_9ACTN|nr:RICIN domain-containing protein [Actinoplanes ianthinogenes]BCJ47417.1 hypothetical protein Aiant_80740 [Actinoplanes ianthinogenes]GGR01666.1 hypothetical protein GCM10010168_17750 [Actinoplanes ianthinogenes]
MRIGRLPTAIATVALTLLTLFVAPAAAQAAGPIYISVLKPTSISPTRVLDMTGWSKEDLTQAQLWIYRNRDEVRNQRWYVEYRYKDSGMGVYRLRNALSNKCLDRRLDGSLDNGDVVQQYTCNDSSKNQQWRAHAKPENTGDPDLNWVRLENMSDGRCLDVTGASFADGAKLQVWDCGWAWNQRWNIY